MTAVKSDALAGSAQESTVFLVEEKYPKGSRFELEFELELILIELPRLKKNKTC